MRATTTLLLLGTLAACAPVPETNSPAPAGDDDAVDTPAQADEQANMIPAGYGSLRQDEFTVPLNADPLLIKVTPLAEQITRLGAPDTYQRLHATRTSQIGAARNAVRGEPELFLVSFFSYQPDTDYRPEDVEIIYQGRVLRPAKVLAVTSGWGRGRLQQRELQSAIYVYDDQIDYDQPITFRYQSTESNAWASMLPRLERERSQVKSSAGN